MGRGCHLLGPLKESPPFSPDPSKIPEIPKSLLQNPSLLQSQLLLCEAGLALGWHLPLSVSCPARAHSLPIPKAPRGGRQTGGNRHMAGGIRHEAQSLSRAVTTAASTHYLTLHVLVLSSTGGFCLHDSLILPLGHRETMKSGVREEAL